MFNHIQLFVALLKADGSYEGYTDSDGNEYTGERGSFTIIDKFIGICSSAEALLDVSQTCTRVRTHIPTINAHSHGILIVVTRIRVRTPIYA